MADVSKHFKRKLPTKLANLSALSTKANSSKKHTFELHSSLQQFMPTQAQAPVGKETPHWGVQAASNKK